MGELRSVSKWPDNVYYGGDHTYISNSKKLDCPQWPAYILLDDIEYEVVTDTGLDLDKGLYMYKIEPYPESHHVDNPVDTALIRLFGRTNHLQWDLNMKGGDMHGKSKAESGRKD